MKHPTLQDDCIVPKNHLLHHNYKYLEYDEFPEIGKLIISSYQKFLLESDSLTIVRIERKKFFQQMCLAPTALMQGCHWTQLYCFLINHCFFKDQNKPVFFEKLGKVCQC